MEGARLKQRGLRQGAVLAGAVVLAGVAGLHGGAVRAGDYFHACRSADGQLVMEAEALHEVDPASGNADGKSLDYKVLTRFALARREGYCLAGKARQKRFGFHGETYLLHISFRAENGQQKRVYLICEEAADGLPAAETCEKEVQTRNWQRRLTQK